jgi:hypothetical protein
MKQYHTKLKIRAGFKDGLTYDLTTNHNGSISSRTNKTRQQQKKITEQQQKKLSCIIILFN